MSCFVVINLDIRHYNAVIFDAMQGNLAENTRGASQNKTSRRRFGEKEVFMPMKWGFDDFSNLDSWRATAAEFFATALFVFLGTGAVVSAMSLTGGEMTPAALIVIAAAHGLAIMALVAATANISGGHINPAVTIALWAAGKIDLGKSIMYIGGQLVGAVVGSLLLITVIDSAFEGGLGTHGLGAAIGNSAGSGFLVEIILTFTLVGAVFMVAVHPRNIGGYAPIAIGMVVLIDHLVAVPLTGASMNPARTFGPALIASINDIGGSVWNAHWIYWAGPIVGGLLAAMTYRYVMLTTAERKAE